MFLFLQILGLFMTLFMYPLFGVVSGWNWALLAPAYLVWLLFDIHAMRCIWQYAFECQIAAARRAIVNQTAQTNF